jgi:hypothetical protein
MTTEDYVSYETAKLLKEKGFDELCPTFYEIDEPNSGPKYSEKLGWFLHNSYDYSDRHGKMIISAPTLQMAMKWLREIHHCVICITPLTFYCGEIVSKWGYCIWADDNTEVDEESSPKLESYEEAAESAIKYCLENLI